MKNKILKFLISFLITTGLVFIGYLLYLFISFLISIIGILTIPIFIGGIFFVWLIIEIYDYLE